MERRGAQLTSLRALLGLAAAVLQLKGSLLELLLAALSAALPVGSRRDGRAASYSPAHCTGSHAEVSSQQEPKCMDLCKQINKARLPALRGS